MSSCYLWKTYGPTHSGLGTVWVPPTKQQNKMSSLIFVKDSREREECEL